MRIRNNNNRKLSRNAAIALVVIAGVLVGACSSAAFVAPQTARTSRSRAFCDSCRELYGSSSFLKQNPGESDMDFFKRIQLAASDPVTFERMALGKGDPKSPSSKSLQSKDSASGTNTTGTKSGYQRAEDWEAEMKAKAKRGEYTWEEKLQFESQKYGNQFNQNEILRKNLKGF